MKIAILINYFQPELGYAEYFLAKEFSKLGHDVSVITSDYYFPFPNYKNTVESVLGKRKRKRGVFIERGIKVYRLPLFFQSKNGAIVLFRKLGLLLQKINPDIMYCDGVFSLSVIQAAFYRDRVGFKLIFDTHASTYNTRLRNGLMKKIYMYIFTLFFIPYIKKKANGFIAIGESERFLLSKEYGINKREIELIPLGADSDLFVPNKNERKKIRNKLLIGKDEKLIVYAGKITPNKDIDILLSAFSKLVLKSVKIKLLIVGKGGSEYVEKLKDLVKEGRIKHRVIWVGMVNNRKLPGYYNASDLGIWPGDLSNTIIEAMSCGLPIILPKKVSDKQTSKHLLKNKNGMSFKRGSISDLVKAIERVIISKNLREMGWRSRVLVEKEYSWKQIARKYLELAKSKM